MNEASYTLGLAAAFHWTSPTWLIEAPTLSVISAAGDASAPALSPLVAIDAAIVDGAGDPLHASMQATALAGDRRTLTLAAEHGLDHIAATAQGDIWLRGFDGSLHSARIGSLVDSTTVRLTEPLRSLPTISVAQPAAIQWAWHEAELAADAELATAGRAEWSVAWRGIGGDGSATGVWRVMRRFDTGLTLHGIYSAPDGDRLAAQQTRRQDHQGSIDQGRRTIERWLRRDLSPRDETVVTDGAQLLDCHILLVHAHLKVKPEELGLRERLMREAKDAYADVIDALLVDLNADGRTDANPYPSRSEFRMTTPSTRLFSIRRS